MTTAPSQKAREGAVPTKSICANRAAPLAPRRSTRDHQSVDCGKNARSNLVAALDLDAKTIRIVSGPVSLRKLVFWGAVIFVAGFLHGRHIRNFATGAQLIASGSAPVFQTTATTPTHAPTQPSSAGVTRATIQLMKFAPQTIEIKTGQTVEWTNHDMTPHTVTSQGAGDLNSGSIDAGASWRHTFTQAGSFQYYCTFHPEMKGAIFVK